jgi:hypothetical protein
MEPAPSVIIAVGYNGRYRYGRYSNGRGTILSAVLAAILNVQSIP